MTKIKFSLVIPCYNESGTITKLVKRCKKIFKDKHHEIIFIDNGSTDNTLKKLEKEVRGINNFKIIKIPVNKGLGYGIFMGLMKTKGEIIGWTHGDLQTDPIDAFKGFEIASQTEGDFLIKGRRINRKFTDFFFSLGMAILESLIHFNIYWEINAQPNIFRKSFFRLWKTPPYDYMIDLYCYHMALKKRLKFIRFEVEMKPRIAGESKWNLNFLSKIIFIIKNIKYSFKLYKIKDDSY